MIYIGGVGHLRIRHDGRWVRVDEYDPETLLHQRLAGLGPGIVKLAGLTYHDGSGPDDQDTADVGAFRHAPQPTV